MVVVSRYWLNGRHMVSARLAMQTATESGVVECPSLPASRQSATFPA